MQPWPARTGQLVPSFQRTDGAVEGRFRALAAHLVQAPALAVAFVAPLLHETAGVVVGAALALIVDDAAVGEQRTVVLVERGQLAEGQVVHQHGGRIGGDCGGQPARLITLTPGTASETPTAPVGFGRGRDQAAVEGAGADGDGRRGIAADLPGDIERRPARRWCSRRHRRPVGSRPPPPPDICPSLLSPRVQRPLRPVPAPAMMISWYSQDSRSSTTSRDDGWLERSIDSEHPAQS